MFLDITKFKNSITGLVGYQQPFDPDYAVIDSNNLISTSGYFVNSNPFAKIQHLKDTQDYANISDADFNLLLKTIIENASVNIVNQVFNKPSYIDRNLIYKNALNKTETETLSNGFVGFQICVSSKKSIGIKVTRLFLDFEGAGTIRLLLFNSSKKQVIKSLDVSIVTDHQEVVLDWVLNDTDGLYKGEYYIGYIKYNTTTVKPYRRNYKGAGIMSYLKCLDIREVFVEGHNTETLFDLNLVTGINEKSGLNLDLTVYDDYTDLIIQNKHLFARAIHLNAVIIFLQYYLSSLRSNRNERQADELYRKILTEIEGTSGEDNVISVKGLRPQLLSEISTIKDEIKKIRVGYFGNGYNVITEG